MAKYYHCPNCAANLVFDPDARKMACAFCGTRISPDNVTSHDAVNGFIQGETWDESASCFLCSNCGAKSISDASTVATFCAFCGAPSMSVTTGSGVKPMRLLPFQYGREMAERAFLQWCRKSWFLPNSFTSKKQIEKLTGMYVPFWLFTWPVDVDCSYLDVARKKDTGSVIGGYIQRVRKGRLLWEKIPLDGSSHIRDDLMECIEPYDFKQLIRFDTKYLAGFFAESYDLPAENLLRRGYLRVKDFVRGFCGEGRVNFNDHSTYHLPTAEYVYLPVWFLNYTYRGKTYSFALNGQTGKVAGDQPISRWKLCLFLLAVFVFLMIVVVFLGTRALGGMFL